MRMATFVLWLMLHVCLGHLGVAQLSAGLLGFTMFRGTALSILISLTAGLNTIGGQAFGAKEYRLVGLVFQRSLGFCLLFSLTIAAVYTQSEWLFNHLGQKPQLAHAAGRFLFLLSPSVVLLAPLLCLQYYWLAQKVSLPSVMSGALSVLVAPAAFWYFIFRKSWGTNGGAIALDVILAFRVVILAIWTVVVNCKKAKAGAMDIAWHGWSVQALRQWGELLKIGMYTILMMSVRGWLFDYYAILSGVLPRPEEAISIFGISLYIFNISMVVARSFNAGLAFAVAHEIGAGNAIQAKYTVRAAFFIMFGVSLLYNCVVLASSKVIGYIWTNDQGVVSRLPSVLLLACATSICQTLAHIFTGVLNGVRRQKEGSRIVSVIYPLLGIPGPWLFSFYLGWGVIGLWTTRLIVVILEVILLGRVVMRLNWEGEVQRAMEVVERQKRDSQPDLPSLLFQAGRSPPDLHRGGEVGPLPDRVSGDTGTTDSAE
ncbi:unnamed protein product [Ostreobium quekettii]|uniref:Protein DETOXIFICATION n=1 Tax=Ostreobium quekettii TaxID=121088 RepID=A0A8S1J6X1_9CHLO|nr:unnamed protein product [Ostreobium quekettii]